MDSLETPRLEVDGEPPAPELVAALAYDGYGHFTAMQVRNHAVRGLGLHLARLDAGNRETFGEALAGERVRDLVRHALGPGTPDASVRVHVQRPDPARSPTVTVIVRPPGGMPDGPWRLLPVPYLRAVPRVKHIGDFGQSYYRAAAERAGYSEALLTGEGGLIAEGAITNVGFFDGESVVWPDAPVLDGTTMLMLRRRLPAVGVASRDALVRLADLGEYRAAFVANSRGIAPVSGIGDHAFGIDGELMKTLAAAREAEPWEPL